MNVELFIKSVEESAAVVEDPELQRFMQDDDWDFTLLAHNLAKVSLFIDCVKFFMVDFHYFFALSSWWKYENCYDVLPKIHIKALKGEINSVQYVNDYIKNYPGFSRRSGPDLDQFQPDSYRWLWDIHGGIRPAHQENCHFKWVFYSQNKIFSDFGLTEKYFDFIMIIIYKK